MTEASPRPNEAWTRRKLAAQKYRPPSRIKLLLVAKAPPPDLDRYFYFEDGQASDILFQEVARVLFEDDDPKGEDKPHHLKELRRRGVFLIDLKPNEPVQEGEKLDSYVPWFLLTVQQLAPEQVVLIGRDVHRAAFKALGKDDAPVVDVAVPFPSSGEEMDFRREFRSALVKAGLEKLIKPMKKKTDS